MNLLDLDARWRRFNDSARQCPCCGIRYSGIFDLGFEQPDDWPHGERGDQHDLQIGDDRLTPELCRIGTRYFLRTVLSLPLRGSDEVFCFGPWVEVSRASFDQYLDTMEDGSADFIGHEGVLANALPGLDTSIGAPVTLASEQSNLRPQAIATEDDLLEAQQNGISFDQLLDVYAAAGHDLRPHLSRD